MPKDAVSLEDMQAEAVTAMGLFLSALCPLVSLSLRALTALCEATLSFQSREEKTEGPRCSVQGHTDSKE